MNKSQKFAWFGLILSILMLGFELNMTTELLSSGSHIGAVIRIWSLLIICSAIALFAFFFRTVAQEIKAKKQKISKVDYDERDHLILIRANVAAFFAVLIALAAASVIPQFVVGQSGVFPAWLLPIINFGVLTIGLIAHSAAILVQYGRQEKINE